MADFLGRIVTIFWPTDARFLEVYAGEVSRSGVRSSGNLPLDSYLETSKYFRVVDGGNRQIALWNLRSRRFLNMDEKRISLSADKADGALTEGSIWERFRVMDVGDGRIGLWSPTFKRFVRMSNDPPDASEVREDATMPYDWVGERLQIDLLPQTIDNDDVLLAGTSLGFHKH